MKRFNQGWLRISITHLVLLSFLILTLSSSLFAEPQRFNQTFRKGDALRLTIWQPWQTGDGKAKNIEFGGEYIIDSRGYVFFPLIGDVNVINHNSSTLAAELKSKFNAYIQDPVVIVDPLIRVTALGAFRRPGTFLVEPDASLWEFVDLAGGPSDNANLQKLSVARGGKIVKAKLLSSFERAFSLREIGVRSGDQIMLPAKSSISMRDLLAILRFAISLLNLYLLLSRLN